MGVEIGVQALGITLTSTKNASKIRGINVGTANFGYCGTASSSSVLPSTMKPSRWAQKKMVSWRIQDVNIHTRVGYILFGSRGEKGGGHYCLICGCRGYGQCIFISVFLCSGSTPRFKIRGST